MSLAVWGRAIAVGALFGFCSNVWLGVVCYVGFLVFDHWVMEDEVATWKDLAMKYKVHAKNAIEALTIANDFIEASRKKEEKGAE